MSYLRLIFLGLIVASFGGGLDASDSRWEHNDAPKAELAHPAPKGRLRAEPQGSYSLTVTGCCRGSGTATVSANAISLTANVVTNAGPATISASNLTITAGHFTGEGTISGIACTFYGRIDIPTAQDGEQTDAQATTGRITGTFRDAAGHASRITAIQLH